MDVRGSNDEPKVLEMDFDLDDVGVTGLVGFEAEGSEFPSLVRFFLRNPSEGIGLDLFVRWGGGGKCRGISRRGRGERGGRRKNGNGGD